MSEWIITRADGSQYEIRVRIDEGMVVDALLARMQRSRTGKVTALKGAVVMKRADDTARADTASGGDGAQS